MEFKEIVSCIENYQKMIADKDKSSLLELYSNSDFVNFSDLNFIPSEGYSNLYLGVNDNKLIGFLVLENIVLEDWNEETTIYISEFSSHEQDYDSKVLSDYDKKVSVTHTSYIETEVAIERIDRWKSDKMDWTANNCDSQTIVKYFKIPSINFTETETNKINLGITAENIIDAIVENRSGLFDVSKPVPPFLP